MEITFDKKLQSRHLNINQKAREKIYMHNIKLCLTQLKKM
jgi:hypothetical protein